MALLYYRQTQQVEAKDISILPVEEEGSDYKVSIQFPSEDDDHDVTEILLTKEEVQEAYDLLFNR